MIDSLSSATWLVSSACNSDICNNHSKYKPSGKVMGDATISLNTGNVTGNIYHTSIDLNNFVLKNTPLLLVKEINVKDFEEFKIKNL